MVEPQAPQDSKVPIGHLHIRNFGCLRDVDLDFGPLTVLVGPNDSGKSMVFRALKAVSDACRSKKGWADLDAEQHRHLTFGRAGGTFGLDLRGFAEGEYVYRTEVGAGAQAGLIFSEALSVAGRSWARDHSGLVTFGSGEASSATAYATGDMVFPLPHRVWCTKDPGYPEERRRFQASLERISGSARVLRGFQPIALQPNILGRSRTQASAIDPDSLAAMTSSGLGLPQAITQLLLQDRDALQRIEDALRHAMPHVRRVDVQQRFGGDQGGISTVDYEIEIVTQQGTRIPSSLISNGVLLFLAYLYVAYGPSETPVILLEEPETGIHPGLLRKVVDLLRAVSAGQLGGPPRQIILTTHSPLLLNYVEPEEVRVVQRGSDGATSVVRFDQAPRLADLLDYQGTGEIWANLGEDYIAGRGTPNP